MTEEEKALVSLCGDEFRKTFEADKQIRALYAKIRDGTATYKEANDFSVQTGNILAKTFKKKLSSSVLPNGQMSEEMARILMGQRLGDNHDLITEATAEIQNAINLQNGLGIKAIIPAINQSRIDGIIMRLSEGVLFDEIAWILDEQVVNFSQSVVTDMARANVNFQHNIGIQTTVERICVGGCCEWCQRLAGVHNYNSGAMKNSSIWKRHDRCRCEVIPNFAPKMRTKGNAFVAR